MLNHKQQNFLAVAEAKCSSTVFKRLYSLSTDQKRDQHAMSLKDQLAGFVFFIGFAVVAMVHLAYIRPLANSFPLLNVVDEIVIFVVCSLHLHMMTSDAGLIRRNSKGSTVVEQIQQSLTKVVQKNEAVPDLGRVCYTCWVDRPLRSKHCKICDRCYDDFDHHCVFIRNCVGGGNRRAFFIYICSIPAALVLHAITLFVAFRVYLEEAAIDEFLWAAFIFVMSWPLAIISLGFVCVFVPAVSMLVSIQTRSILYNLSTNEMANLHRYSHFWMSETSQVGDSGAVRVNQKFSNPFDRGPWQNWIDFWMRRPQRPVCVSGGPNLHLI